MLFDYESGIPEIYKRQGGNYPGQISKTGFERKEAFNSSSPSDRIEFGQVVKRIGGASPYVTAISADDTAPRFFGVAINDVLSESIANLDLTNPRLIKQYFSGSVVSVLTEGFICVPVQNGNPVVGDPVYVRIAASETNSALPIGGIETAGTGCVKWKGARFESTGFYPFISTNNGTSASGVTGKCAIIFLEDERYGLELTLVSSPTNPTVEYGTPNSAITLTGGSVSYQGETVSGSFAMNNPSTVLDAGTNETTCTFTPDDPIYEQITNVPITVTVTKGTLTINTLPTASDVYVGDTLSTSTISSGVVKYGDVTVAGSWVWQDGTTVVNATGSFAADFVPTTGAGNYNTLSTNLTVTANKISLTTWTAPNATSVAPGQTLSNSVLSGGEVIVAGYPDDPIPGSWAWDDGTIVVNETGNFLANFTPTNTDKYNPTATYTRVEALSNNTTVTSVTVNSISATLNNDGDWEVTVPSDTAYLYGGDVVVVTEDTNATAVVTPTGYFTNLVPGDVRKWTLTVTAQNGTIAQCYIWATVATS